MLYDASGRLMCTCTADNAELCPSCEAYVASECPDCEGTGQVALIVVDPAPRAKLTVCTLCAGTGVDLDV